MLKLIGRWQKFYFSQEFGQESMVKTKQMMRRGSAGRGSGKPKTKPAPMRPDHGGKQPKSQGGKKAPEPKPHRFRPCTVTLQEIRRYQKSTEPLIRRLPFEQLVREILQTSDHALTVF